MSLLACFLLSLAVLLTGTSAQNNCKTKLFGNATHINTEYQVPFPATGELINIRKTDKLVGVMITVCNNHTSGVAPDVVLVYDPALSPVDVRCSDGCPEGGIALICMFFPNPWPRNA